MNKDLLIIILGIFMVSSVFALGVSPARTTIDFEPNLKQTITFEVINSEGKDLSLTGMVVNSELDEYISLPMKGMHISAAEKSKKFSYEISLPWGLTPGLHTGEILIMESVPDKSEASTQVLATLAVVTQLYVYVPYPGKYANTKMVVYNANQGDEVAFVFPVVSAGEFDLTSVRANVEIYNKMGAKVGEFITSEIEVKSGEKKEIVHKWKADVPVGEYRAVASVVYDEGVINLEEFFNIGSKEIELKEINVKEFSLGEIAKIEMLVENKWSEPISGVFIDTKIKNNEGELISNFQSSVQNIGALSKQIFNSYWDTSGVRVGTYETEVSINYAEKSSKKNFKFLVDENELTIMGLGYVVSNDKSSEGNNLVFILVVVIGLLVLINILWFFIIRKKLRGNL